MNVDSSASAPAKRRVSQNWRTPFRPGDIVCSEKLHSRMEFGIVTATDRCGGAIVRPQLVGASEVVMRAKDLRAAEFVNRIHPATMRNIYEGWVS
jgi:hypothetical protein